MIWVGSHSGGLCRFDRQTGKFLPEYFDLGYHQSQGDKAGLKDNVHCMYKDRAGTLWVGNRTGLHKIILTAAKAGRPSRVTIQHYKHDSTYINTLSSTCHLYYCHLYYGGQNWHYVGGHRKRTK